MSNSNNLTVGDFVSVERSDKPHQPLKGVIAFMGAVSFAEGSDWVGVRLTGDSVGEGRNDGSVKGKRYFEDCGLNGGVFVRKSAVSKRQPTRLEELRLRRERKAVGASGLGKGGSSGGVSSGVSSLGGRGSPAKASMTPSPRGLASKTLKTSSTTKSNTGGTDRGGISSSTVVQSEGVSRVKKQMEQLRKNRSSLGSSSLSTSTTTSSTASSTISSATSRTPTSTALSAEKEREIKTLKDQNDSLTEQNEELTSQKESLQQELHDLRMQLSSIKENQLTEQQSEDNAKANTFSNESNNNDNDTPSPSSTAADNESINNLQNEIHQLKTQLQSTTTQLTETHSTITDLETKSQTQQTQIQTLQTQLHQTKTQLSTAEHELTTISSQNSTHQSAAQSQLKERAKLTAENSSLKRQLSELEKEKVDVESMMEEMTLDLEQVKEEKEGLEDLIQEKNLELETQLIDMEDLKIQLEEVGVQLDQSRQQLYEQQQQSQSKSQDTGDGDGGDGATANNNNNAAQSADTEDVVQALSIQNARLREALLRLREQSTYEKMELSKQLRSAEKEASQFTTLQSNHEKLQADLTQKEKDIRELKEMVDEGHAYENLMEEMSDKNIELEDANVALKAMIQSLEEASEIAAEMEEVQAEENKALMSDLEERDAKLRNLQEAIKMQRRREEDFQRTVLKYKTSIEKLQTEKSALLALHQGGENENSQLIASSQKALAQAAQLVSDAAQMRKKESLVMFDKLERNLNAHFADRLQNCIPKAVIHKEVLAVKGELLLSKVAEKASLGLQGIASLFQKSMAKARADLGTDMIKVVPTSDEEKTMEKPIMISELASQEIPTILHELKFAHISIRVSAEALRLLYLGQWPDLLTEDLSAQLGAAVLPPLSDVDNSITYQLRMLKEEGTLSPHRINLGTLEESVNNIRTPLSSITPLAQDWIPPAWEIFQNATSAKYSCMCAAAIVSCIISPSAEAGETFVPDFDSDSSVAGLLNKLENIASESSKISQRLTDLSLDEGNNEVLKQIEAATKEWKESSDALMILFQSTFNVKEVSPEKILECETHVEQALQCAIKLSALLRSHKMMGEDVSAGGKLKYHPLSPEANDCWMGAMQVIMKELKFKGIGGDEEEVLENINFGARCRAIEKRLELALENDSKLAVALVQVSTLEKTLASRSKEINMQNARMVELEKLLSQSSYQSPRKSPKKSDNKGIEAFADVTTSEEFNAVKKENTMLMEAMDVLNKQVQEYEDEVRALKNASKFKSPQKGSMRSPLSPAFGVSDFMEIGSNIPDSMLVTSAASQAKLISLEAALFRPALHAAQTETNTWRAKVMKSSLSQLTPLNVPKPHVLNNNPSPQPQDGENTVALTPSQTTVDQPALEALSRCLDELFTANAGARVSKASTKVVNLSNKKGKSHNLSRKDLRQQNLKHKESLERLDKASIQARDLLTKFSSGSAFQFGSSSNAKYNEKRLLGKVIVPSDNNGSESILENRVIPMAVNMSELNRLHATLVQ